MAGIFISYRRKENTKDARILFERLGKSFGRRVFMDTDGVSYGDDFERKINAQLDRCTVMLALIGPGWEHLVDEHTGERRLDQSGDWVRIEIAAALRREIRVIPVLIDRARLPAERDLPEPLRSLLKRQAFPLHLEQGFEQGMQDLVAAIRPDMGMALPGWVKAALSVVVLGGAGAGAYWQVNRPSVPVTPAPQAVAAPIPVTPTPAPTPAPPPVPQVGQVIKDCADCPELVLLPKGSFVMGSPDSEPEREKDEGPQHKVQINYTLAVGKYEVTQGQWKAVMGSNPSGFSSCGDTCPVENVSWDMAQEYLKKLNAKSGQKYRLLSEAEWEYAARAGTTTAYAFGATLNKSQADMGSNTVKVGRFDANAFGLHDMHGNVWEWVQDCWHDSYENAPINGESWETNCTEARRVLRGGSWYVNPRILRSANRYGGSPDYRVNGLGFRITRTFSL